MPYTIKNTITSNSGSVGFQDYTQTLELYDISDVWTDLTLENFISAIYDLSDTLDIVSNLDQAPGFVSREVLSDTDDGITHTLIGQTVWESKAANDAYAASVPPSPLLQSGNLTTSGKSLVGKDLIDSNSGTTTTLDIKSWIYWRWVIDTQTNNIKEYIGS